jgi:hypothetical protein
MIKHKTVREQWHHDDAVRQGALDQARFCASLTKPWYLPPLDQDPNSKLPETFSSLAARGISNLEGRLLLALYPPGLPFFRFMPAARFLYDANTPPEMLQEFESQLHLRELVVLSKLESSALRTGDNTRRSGFRTRKRQAIAQLLITGDVLERIGDDYRIQVYRRDAYVTSRDESGDVRYHITREKIDPLILNNKQLEIANLDRGTLQAKPVNDRLEDLFTMAEWQPEDKIWIVRQEVRDKIVLENKEKITPFMSTPYELAPGEDYGRGIVEQNLGDVRSMNELTERLLDFAALASKQLIVTDYNSQVRPQDLTRPSGSVIQGRVVGGQVQDIATLKADKVNDFSVAQAVRESVRRDLAATMLMEGENQPTGERVTAFQIQRIALELEGALGGVYAPIADAQQVPLIERVLFMMERDGLLAPLPEDSVEVEALTGIAALSREGDQGKLLNLMGVLGQLGGETMSRIDMGVLTDLLMRQSGIFEPGLVKTDEQLQQEQQAAMEQQAQMTATEKAIDVGGNVVEQAATTPQEENNDRSTG